MEKGKVTTLELSTDLGLSVEEVQTLLKTASAKKAEEVFRKEIEAFTEEVKAFVASKVKRGTVSLIVSRVPERVVKATDPQTGESVEKTVPAEVRVAINHAYLVSQPAASTSSVSSSPSDKKAEIVRLFFEEGKRQSEIADLLGLSKGYVWAVVDNHRRIMKKVG